MARSQLPDEQRDLLLAFSRFLRQLTELTASAGDRLKDGPAAFLLYAIWLRVVQLGRAVEELCVVGFAPDAQMLARAMIGATLDIFLICENDSDQRALLYALFQRQVRRERSKALVQYHHLTPERAAELEKREQETDAKAHGAHAAAGTKPAGRLGNAGTWSGLSVHQLSKRFSRPGWYDLFYSPFSDTAHVNAAAIDREVTQLLEGKVYLGGRFDSPWLVIVAASEAVSGAAEALDTVFSLGSASTRGKADQEMLRALGAYAARTRPA